MHFYNKDVIELLKKPSKNDIISLQREIDRLLRKATSKLVGNGFILAQSEQIVEKAMEICESIDDENRQAIAIMVMGRIRYAQSSYDESLSLHKKAMRIWRHECDDSSRNQKQAEENFVYMLKTMVAMGIRPEYRTTVVLECNNSSQKRLVLRSKFINLGKVSNTIDTMIQKIILYFLH